MPVGVHRKENLNLKKNILDSLGIVGVHRKKINFVKISKQYYQW